MYWVFLITVFKSLETRNAKKSFVALAIPCFAEQKLFGNKFVA